MFFGIPGHWVDDDRGDVPSLILSESLNPSADRDDVVIMTVDALPQTVPSAASATVLSVAEPAGPGLSDRIRRRRWPLVMTAVVVATGMAFFFFFDLVVHHAHVWATSGDLWGIYRGAHYVGWGELSGVYSGGVGIIAFPGIEVLLAPVAMLTGHFNMSESYGPFTVFHPTAALVLVPVELLLGATVLFAIDALAERMSVRSGRRAWLSVAAGVVLFPVVAVWGHAEDVLTVTFAIYALLALHDRKWSKCGWLLGFGIVMQPLIALALPLFVGASPAGQRLWLVVRSCLLSAALVGLAFLGNASATYQAVIKQPSFPGPNHTTPWLSLAPKISVATTTKVHAASLVAGLGHPAISTATALAEQSVVVTGGLGRTIYMLLAIALGVYVWRRPQQWIQLVWLVAAVLVARCFFEAVICPYYLAPGLFVALATASSQNAKRFWSAAILSAEITVFSYFHYGPWIWWPPVVVVLCVILALAYPSAISEAHRYQPRADASGGTCPVDVPEVTGDQAPVGREPVLV